MSTDARVFPKAFAVWFKDLGRWDIGFFKKIAWQWDEKYVKPIGRAIVRKSEVVVRPADMTEVPIIEKISFGGLISVTDVEQRKGYKGRLFWADVGDFIYSKIRAKQGSLAVIPASIGKIAVSAEYPVFSINQEVCDPNYLTLVLKSRPFLNLLEGLSHGGLSKTRIPPETFESLEIPLPSLAIQTAIVARWQQAQEELLSTHARIRQMEATVEDGFFAEIGIKLPEEVERPKYFAVQWKELPRWSVRFVADFKLGLDRLPHARFDFVTLGQIALISYGIQKSPANRPSQHARPYLRVANVRKGYLDLSEIKTINVPDEDLETYRLKAGDILFVEGNGSRAELGRVAIWSDEIPNCVHQNHLIKVRPDKARLLPEFAMTWFNTEIGRGHFFRAAKTSSGLGTINSEEVRNAPIPLPPLEAQREIMRYVEERRAEIARERDAATRRAQECEAEVEALILGTKELPA